MSSHDDPPPFSAAQALEKIPERISDAYCVLDREFRIQSVNGATERLLGLSRTTIVGRSHWEVFPASVDAPIGAALRRVVEEGTEEHLAHHYVGEGYDLYLEVDAYPTEEGGIALFWRNVTERVQAKLTLQASEAKYRTLFNEMDEAYAVVEVLADAQGQWTDFLFIDANPAFVRHTGMPYPVGRMATELLGRPNPRWAELYGRVVETGEALRVEESELTLGRIFDLNIFRLGNEASRRVAVLFTDVTERRQAQDALRGSEERQTFLLKLSDTLRAQPDVDAVVNRALGLLAEQLNLDRCYIGVYRIEDDWGEFPYQVGNDRVPPVPSGVRLSDFPDALRVAIDQTLAIGDVAHAAELSEQDRQNLGALGMGALVASTLRKGQGRPFWSIVVVSATARHWTASEIALIEEVTERIWTAVERAQAEEALRAVNTSLEEKVEERTRRLADLNAELGTLITRTARTLEAPVGYLSQFLAAGQDGEGVQELTPSTLSTLHDELSRLKGITQDLQQLAQLEVHDLRRDLLPLSELFAEVREALGETRVAWSVRPLPIVRGDRALLRQALEVVLKFTLSETRGARQVEAYSQDVDGEVWVTVQDDGVSLGGEEAATLFDLAVRSEQSVPLLEGSGLAQARRILARHGGWAWAEALRGGRIILAFPRDDTVNEVEALFE